ncbi:MAG: PAS domain-containing protein [Steroidobacteraceae bacterium]
MNAFRDELLTAGLGSSAELQRLALQKWPGEVLGFDALLRLRWANDRALQALGAAGQPQPVGRGWEELRLPWPLLPEDFDQVLSGQEYRLSAATLGQRMGRMQTVDVLLTPLKSGEEVQGVLLTSEQVPALDARVALASAQAGQWQRDLATGLGSIDAGWCEALKLDPCSGVDHASRWEQQIHPDDIEEYRRRWQQLLSGALAEFETEFRILTLDHEWLWVLQRGRAVRFEGRSPVLVAGVCLEIDRRKREETAARSNESRLATALWGAQAAFWQWHVPTNQRTMSPLWNAMTGYRREQWNAEADPWRVRIHPEDQQRVREHIDAYLHNGADSLEYEYRLRTANGQWKWLLDRGRAVEWDLEGRPAVIMGVALDIDAQKRAEMELRASENRLQTAVWGANMGLWELDFSVERTRWVNDWCSQYGIDPCDGGDHVNRWDAHIHEADVTEAARRFAEHVAGKEDYYDAEYRVMTDFGAWRWIYERGRVTERDADGKALRIVGVCMDIDARRQEEMRQHFTQPWLAQALTMARAGMWHWDVLTGQMICTSTYYRLFGTDPDDSRGDRHFWSRRMHPEDLQRMRGLGDGLISGGQESFDTEYRMLSADGEWLWVHDCAHVAARDASGKATSVIGFITDCTARHENLEALRASELRFRCATMAIQGLIYEVDYERDHAVRFGTETLLGLPPDAIAPDRGSWLALVHPDDVAGFLAQRPGHGPRSEVDQLEYRLRHRDGHYVRVRDYAMTMRLTEQQAPHRIGFIQDISEEHRRDERLRAQIGVFDALREGVLLVDRHWRVRMSNASSHQLLGSDGDAVRGALLPDLLGADAAHWLPICAEMDTDPDNRRDHSFTVTCHPRPDVNLPCSLLLRAIVVDEQRSYIALLQPLPGAGVLPSLLGHDTALAIPVVGGSGAVAGAGGAVTADADQHQSGAIQAAN